MQNIKEPIQKRIDVVLMDQNFTVATTDEDKTTGREVVDKVLDPKVNMTTVLVPQGEGELFATAIELAGRTTAENFERVAAYCLRLYDNDNGEYAALALREAFKHNTAFTSSPAYIHLVTQTDLGKAIAGGA